MTNEIQTNITNTLQEFIDNDTEMKNALMSNPDMLKRILQSNLLDELKQDVKTQTLVMRYNFQDVKNDFLAKAKSENTQSAYNFALMRFENYCKEHGTQPLASTAHFIDRYIIDLKAQGNFSNATIRRDVAVLSAFWSYLERRTDGAIRNVVKGTKERPKNTPTKKNKFYSVGTVDVFDIEKVSQDLQYIIDHEKNLEFKAILIIMQKCGLRCGAFYSMTIHGNKYTTETKGKTIHGVLPCECINAIDKAGLRHNTPFTDWNATRVKLTVRNHVKKLFDNNKIAYKYSAHDFRHYFALNEYLKDKDIYRVSKLLNHANIAITENYLRGLHVELKTV